jgi:hypothetical protein
MININDKEIINKIGWLLDVRRGGIILEINRKDKQENDIFIGNVIDKNKNIDPNKIKICRGGEAITINSKDKLLNDHIEYKYLKYELEEVDGKVVYNEEMAKEYILNNFIKPRLIEKYKNTEKAITDPAGNNADYQAELQTIEILGYEDLKKYKVK